MVTWYQTLAQEKKLSNFDTLDVSNVLDHFWTVFKRFQTFLCVLGRWAGEEECICPPRCINSNANDVTSPSLSWPSPSSSFSPHPKLSIENAAARATVYSLVRMTLSPRNRMFQFYPSLSKHGSLAGVAQVIGLYRDFSCVVAGAFAGSDRHAADAQRDINSRRDRLEPVRGHHFNITRTDFARASGREGPRLSHGRCGARPRGRSPHLEGQRSGLPAESDESGPNGSATGAGLRA